MNPTPFPPLISQQLELTFSKDLVDGDENNIDFSFIEHLQKEKRAEIATLVNECIEDADKLFVM
jgi:hypothetical protein